MENTEKTCKNCKYFVFLGKQIPIRKGERGRWVGLCSKRGIFTAEDGTCALFEPKEKE